MNWTVKAISLYNKTIKAILSLRCRVLRNAASSLSVFPPCFPPVPSFPPSISPSVGSNGYNTRRGYRSNGSVYHGNRLDKTLGWQSRYEAERETSGHPSTRHVIQNLQSLSFLFLSMFLPVHRIDLRLVRHEVKGANLRSNTIGEGYRLRSPNLEDHDEP